MTVLEPLLRTRESTVEHAEIVWQALRKFVANKADVADGPIERCAHAAGCKPGANADCDTNGRAGGAGPG